MMPAAVDVRAEGGVAALRRRRVGASSGSAVSTTSLFVGGWRRRPRRQSCSVRALRQGQGRSSRGGLGIVCNLGGQYEDTFDDVQLVRCTATVLSVCLSQAGLTKIRLEHKPCLDSAMI